MFGLGFGFGPGWVGFGSRSGLSVMGTQYEVGGKKNEIVKKKKKRKEKWSLKK